MDREGQVRKEPTLADLEAFEQLLRESLEGNSPVPKAVESAPQVKVAQPEAAPPPAAAQPVPPDVAPPVERSGQFRADQSAMAELARLIDAPVDLGGGAFGPISGPAHQSAEREDVAPVQDDIVYPAPNDAPNHPPNHTHGIAAASLAQAQPAQNASIHPAIPAPHPEPSTAAYPPETPALDPLAAFEEELRRFDAIRLSEQQVAQNAARVDDLRPAYPAEDQSAPRHDLEPEWYPDDQAADASAKPAHFEPLHSAPVHPAPSAAEASLHAAESRLASQSAAAAAAAGVVRGNGRSKGIFLAMGGLAVAGLAVVGGSFIFGSGSKGGKPGEVPVIAAKTSPTKEKPANPGGMEIPNQNKEVLASRTQSAVKPATVVNTTEQPLDLNQATKREPVRVIAPSPYQSGAPVADTARAGAAQANPSAQPIEPRRVSSVRIPVPGQAAVPTVGAAALAGGAVSAAPQTPPAQVPPASAVAAPRAVVSAPLPPQRAPVPQLQAPVPTTPTAAAPVKVESRPVTATATQPRTQTPRTAPPAIASVPRAEPRRPANAPLSLTPTGARAPSRAAAPAGSGWAIQLASRPTEADARAATTSLKARYASTLGARNPSVVNGQANGKTVYRVRVAGYSQAGAAEACKKIKAAGGGCFITRQ